ncbi:hypothetical protein CapIbe_018363 [Capra ibex]
MKGEGTWTGFSKGVRSHLFKLPQKSNTINRNKNKDPSLMEKASSTAGSHHVHGKTQAQRKAGAERHRESPGPPLGPAAWDCPATSW